MSCMMFNTVRLMCVYPSGNVRPVCLPNAGVNLDPERQAWVSGWGTLQTSGESDAKCAVCWFYFPYIAE